MLKTKPKTFPVIINVKSTQTFSMRFSLAFSQVASSFSLSDNMVFCFSMVSSKLPTYDY